MLAARRRDLEDAEGAVAAGRRAVEDLERRLAALDDAG
jgi:hypothetical protein